jgi:hypothetical protein
MINPKKTRVICGVRVLCHFYEKALYPKVKDSLVLISIQELMFLIVLKSIMFLYMDKYTYQSKINSIFYSFKPNN